jgi:single-strand DNA-binding protein
MLNRVVLIGRLTKDPELRYTQSGIAVASFTLAVDRNYSNAKGEKETDFIPCVVFRQLAELCSKYLAKGKLAAIDGRIQVRSYDGQDGQRKWTTEVLGDNVRFLSPKDGSGPQGSYGSDGNMPFMDEISLDDDVPF